MSDVWSRLAGRATGRGAGAPARPAPARIPDDGADLLEEVHEVVVHRTERQETTVVQERVTKRVDVPAPATPVPAPPVSTAERRARPVDAAPEPRRADAVVPAGPVPDDRPPELTPSRRPTPPAASAPAPEPIVPVAAASVPTARAADPVRERPQPIARAVATPVVVTRDADVPVPARPAPVVVTREQVRTLESAGAPAVALVEPLLRVTIGRVDVRTSRAPLPAPPPVVPDPSPPLHPAVSLSDYLAGRSSS